MKPFGHPSTTPQAQPHARVALPALSLLTILLGACGPGTEGDLVLPSLAEASQYTIVGPGVSMSNSESGDSTMSNEDADAGITSTESPRDPDTAPDSGAANSAEPGDIGESGGSGDSGASVRPGDSDDIDRADGSGGGDPSGHPGDIGSGGGPEDGDHSGHPGDIDGGGGSEGDGPPDGNDDASSAEGTGSESGADSDPDDTSPPDIDPVAASTAPVTCNAPDADVQARFLERVNAARAQARSCGTKAFAAAPPVVWNDRLAAAATTHSGDMARHNFFSHAGSDGSSVATRVDAADYRWRTVGENIAAGQNNVSEAVEGWIASPGHCRNLMNPDFVDIALACVADANSDYGVYWTNVLAAPR